MYNFRRFYYFPFHTQLFVSLSVVRLFHCLFLQIEKKDITSVAFETECELKKVLSSIEAEVLELKKEITTKVSNLISKAYNFFEDFYLVFSLLSKHTTGVEQGRKQNNLTQVTQKFQ